MGLQRSYYDDGTLRYEGELLDGKLPHGIIRLFHPNGVLAEELSMDRGIHHGTSRQWSKQGQLLGESHFVHGTGTLRHWADNGLLLSEMSFVDGQMTGRFSCWWEDDGKLVAHLFYLKNRKVSKKRYLEACEGNPSYPRYEADSTTRKKRASKKQKRAANHTESASQLDKLPTQLLRNAREARVWLQEQNVPFRSLGEMPDQLSSLEFVEELYAVGAVGVHAVEIDIYPEGEQNTGKLVVELPTEASKRNALFDFCGDIAAEQGFDLDPDVGQKYAFLMLD